MSTMMPASRFPVLSCLTSRDEETGLFLSHCLTYDLMEFGKTPDEAWENLKLCIKHYIEQCYTNYPEGLSASASREEWTAYIEELKNTKIPLRIDEITLELKPPLPDYEFPIWMEGVSENVGSCTHVH